MAMELACCTTIFMRGSISSPSRGGTAGFTSFNRRSCHCTLSPASMSLISLPANTNLWTRRPRRNSRPSLHAVEGNSTSTTSSSTPESGEKPKPSRESDETPNSSQELSVEEQESLGKALNQLRQERIAKGKYDPSKTEEFWQGVLEETKLIEWPSLQKVLSTTGVVVSIILGSSLVLLTVNALLAQLSDAFFNNSPPV